MLTHDLNPDIALPAFMGELRALNYNGRICLTDEARVFSGAVCRTPEFDSISARFNYESLGYAVMREGPGQHERGPLAVVSRGRLGEIQQANYLSNSGKLHLTALDPDLQAYRKNWTSIFQSFANEMLPVLQDDFEIRLKILEFSEEWKHGDIDMVGILPIGNGVASTVCATADGDLAIRPMDNEFVITAPGQDHSWPVSASPRLGLAVTKYEHKFR